MSATDTPSQQSAPAPPVGRRPAFRILPWTLVLFLLGAAWFMLLARVAPARLDFSSAGATLFASTPPFLLTLLLWTGVQRYSSSAQVAVAPLPTAAPLAPSGPAVPVARFRVGGWSAITPHGGVIETLEGTRARSRKFSPDKAIPHPSGYPAHAAMIASLKLEALGHPAATRQRAPRVMAMLCAVLDDLHAQQGCLVESLPGPVHVYWMAPPALLAEDRSHAAIFAAAWTHSAWRDSAHLLHMVPVGASMFNVLSNLQEEIDQSSVPYTILLAADSMLHRDELAPAMERGHVFSPTSPNGFIPSEGAAGILLFNPGKCSEDLWSGAAIAEPVKAVAREGSSNELGGVISAALVASGKDASGVSFVVSDSDHRTSGSMEVVGAMVQVLANLDPLEHRISPMEYAGAFGAATDLINLALACELAADESVVAVSTQYSQLAAMVVRPA